MESELEGEAEMKQLSFSESGALSTIPRLCKFESPWSKTQYMAEAPEDIKERIRVRELWLAGECIEPFPNGHLRFNRPECRATLDEIHEAGLRGWWELEQTW